MGRRPWRNHAVATLPRREGGLNYQDVRGFTDALQAKWIQRILDPSKDHQLYAVLVNCVRAVVEPEGGDLCSVTYGNVRWKNVNAALYPWLQRMLSANDRVGWKHIDAELGSWGREKLWSLCLWRNPLLCKESGGLPSSTLAVRFGYRRVGDLVVNKFAADACRWINRADVAKWVPDRYLRTVFKSLMEIKGVVQHRFGERITATASRNINDVVIVSQADEYQGAFQHEPLWKVTEILSNGAEVKLSSESPCTDDDGEPIQAIQVKAFRCTPVETCRNVPIGVVERSSINLEDFAAVEYGGKAVRMSDASVKDMYRSIMTNGLRKKARAKDTVKETNWRVCVWNKQLLPKLQVFLYRLRNGALFCGSRMRNMRAASGMDASCLRGCGELRPDTRHDLQDCPNLVHVMAKAAAIGGWQRGVSPLDAVWEVRKEKEREKREEEDRTRAHMTSMLYIAYLEILEGHFEEEFRTSSSENRIREWQSRVAALSREVRLFKCSAESSERSRRLDNTAAAFAMNH